MTTTTWSVLPEIVEPDFVDELVTITAMYGGSGPAGGGELLPGSVLQVEPHAGVAGFLAKPLKSEGAEPPLREFVFDHCAPQKVTVPIEVKLPTTNAPPPWSAYCEAEQPFGSTG